jgi:hypothetical protein
MLYKKDDENIPIIDINSISGAIGISCVRKD